jgi:hypothetical protein
MARRVVAFTEEQLLGLHRFVQALLHSDHPKVRREVEEALGDIPRRDVLAAATQLQAAVATRVIDPAAIGGGR